MSVDAHVVALSVLYSCTAVAIGVAQAKLVAAHREMRVPSHKHGSPHQLTVFLVALMMLPVTAIARLATRSFPCVLHTLWVQVFVSLVSALVVYKTLGVAHKMASLEQAIATLSRARSRKRRVGSAHLSARAVRGTWVGCIATHLTSARVRFVAVGVFVLCVALWFANDVNIAILRGEDSKGFGCTASVSGLATLVWYIGIVPYCCVARSSELRSTFTQQFRYLAFEMAALTLSIVAILLSRVAIRDERLAWTVGTYLMFPFILSVLILHSILPALRGRRSGVVAFAEPTSSSTSRHGRPKLRAVLASSDTLRAFMRHLLHEWSIENLLFFKAVVVFELSRTREAKRTSASSGVSAAKDSQKRLREVQVKAFRIYNTFVRPDAPQQVNLSSDVATPLCRFFETEPFCDWEQDASLRSSRSAGSAASEGTPVFDGAASASAVELGVLQPASNAPRTPPLQPVARHHHRWDTNSSVATRGGGESESESNGFGGASSDSKAVVAALNRSQTPESVPGSSTSMPRAPDQRGPPHPLSNTRHQTARVRTVRERPTREAHRNRSGDTKSPGPLSPLASGRETQDSAKVKAGTRRNRSMTDDAKAFVRAVCNTRVAVDEDVKESPALTATLSVFSAAKDEVYNLMERDSYPRFLANPEYQQIVAATFGHARGSGGALQVV